VGKFKDIAITEENAARSRRGKNNRNRGNQLERTLVHDLEDAGIPAKRVGQHLGVVDVQAEGAAISAKKGGAFSTRYQKWLDELKPRADELSVLVVEDAPGSGIKASRIVVMSWDDWISLMQQARE